MYHLHIDSQHMTENFAQLALSCGMVETNFSGHPEGYRHFAPDKHLTSKTKDFKLFCRLWEQLVTGAQQSPGFVGYLEGEFIPLDQDFPVVPFDPNVPFPFKVLRRRLTQAEGFRQSEIHLTMDKDASDPRLIRNFLDSGLYGAYLPKRDHTAIVITIQGMRNDICVVLDLVRSYLLKAGGAVKASLKEEVAIRYYLQGISVDSLPEIAAQVDVF